MLPDAACSDLAAIFFEMPISFIQEPGSVSATIVLDFGDWGCIGSRVEATFTATLTTFEGTGRPKTPPMIAPPLMPPHPYQPRHLAKPSRDKDLEIVLGLSPERSPAAFVRPPRKHSVPEHLRAMFDSNDQGGLRRELSHPSENLSTYAHNVRSLKIEGLLYSDCIMFFIDMRG